MGQTKERILSAALELFARSGYEAVSVSDIAGELGMTKGALYKHYRSKRDIFDHIVARMEQQDAARAGEFRLPEGTLAEMEEQYRSASLEALVQYSAAQLHYWTEDAFAAPFRRLLTLEQYRSEELGRLYQQYLAAGPLGYVADLLTSLGVDAPQRQAAALYGAMFLFYSMYDGAEDGAAVLAQGEAYIAAWRQSLTVRGMRCGQ